MNLHCIKASRILRLYNPSKDSDVETPGFHNAYLVSFAVADIVFLLQEIILARAVLAHGILYPGRRVLPKRRNTSKVDSCAR